MSDPASASQLKTHRCLPGLLNDIRDCENHADEAAILTLQSYLEYLLQSASTRSAKLGRRKNARKCHQRHPLYADRYADAQLLVYRTSMTVPAVYYKERSSAKCHQYLWVSRPENSQHL